MKNILRAMVILLIICGTYVLFIQYGAVPEKKSNDSEPQVSNEEAASGKRIHMPTSGLLSFMGKSDDDVKKNLGNRNVLTPRLMITNGGFTIREKTNMCKSGC